MFRFVAALIPALLFLGACSHQQPVPDHHRTLTVAAAANLTNAFDEIGKAFTAQTGVNVIYSYGATAQLAQQIRSGAPFDLFASADAEHVDELVREGKLLAESRAEYARGQLALWIPEGRSPELRTVYDLTSSQVRFIAIANPELAPYGRAAIEALKALKLWNQVQPKVTYANSISMARQFAATGNADAAFTAYSLVLKDSGTILRIDAKLHNRLDQALGIATATPHPGEARQLRDFLLGSTGQEILSRYGYLAPSTTRVK